MRTPNRKSNTKRNLKGVNVKAFAVCPFTENTLKIACFDIPNPRK